MDLWSQQRRGCSQNGRHDHIDLRGHGRSTETDEQTTNDSNHLAADVHAAIGWMQRNGAERVSLIGAELGANIALNVAANAPDIEKVVLLSPGLNIPLTFLEYRSPFSSTNCLNSGGGGSFGPVTCTSCPRSPAFSGGTSTLFMFYTITSCLPTY